ncbi:hypothetical protein SELMODRAFT_424990 [Selaginella moellendorffii]|uniref:Uncharacterized protein n=1 Tax=Selaginella moellendorffii TaxID=88036 RepID=D8SRN8_SELML|nr:hypothetical protein SELMODRAFT_424990 [Selaginella moellendorffii]
MAPASVENLAMLPDGAFAAVLKLMLRPDRDEEWANTVCIPFKKIPVSAQDLEIAINAPLLAPLPVSRKRFNELERAFGAKANELFVTPDRFFTEDISGLASLIFSPLNANASEGIYDLSLPHLWNLLVSVLEVWPITVSRNFCDHSSSTSKKTRPDLLFWAYDRLVLKTEHKRYESELFEAWDDLRSKMTSLDKIFYGKIEWILGLATAAGKFRFGAFKRGEDQHLTPEWNLASIKDRQFSKSIPCDALSLPLNQ